MRIILSALFAALLFFMPTHAAARGSDLSDPAARSGRLGNGLAYFIGRSEKPGPVSLRLIVRVGTVHGGREPHAAHILEHVVVEKVRDIPVKGTVRERLARIGASMNAATGSFSTEYFIDVPSADPSALAMALDVVTDWAHVRDLTDEEIGREHNAVIEEVRRGSPAGLSPEQLQQSVWFAGHKFLDLVPNRPGIVDASAATIRRLHRDYYTSGDMALVITGDVDPDAMLNEVVRRFGSLAASPRMSSLKARAPSLRGGHYLSLAGDETAVMVSFKLRPAAAGSDRRVRDLAVAKLLGILAQQGFANVSEREGAAIGGGSIAILPAHTQLYGTDVLAARSYVRRGDMRAAVSGTLGLLATLRRRGFSQAEVDRAQKVLAATEPVAGGIREEAARWVGAFADGAPPPTSAQLAGAVASLSAADVNRTVAAWLDPAHRDIFVIHAARYRAAVPGAADIPALIAEAEAGPEPEPSFSPPPTREPHLAPVSIAPVSVPTPAREASDLVRWTLPRSGATLLFRRTDKNRVHVVMRRAGGEARFERSAAIGARAAADVVEQSGLGGLNRFDLMRFLAARELSLRTAVASNREQLSASGPVGSWPQLLALIQARMTGPQCSEEGYRAYAEGQKNLIDGGGDEAVLRMVDAAIGTKWRPDLADLDRFTAEGLCRQYRQMFGDIAGGVIVVEGNIEPALVYQGVASVLDLASGIPFVVPDDRPLIETAGGQTILRRGSGDVAKVSLVLAIPTAVPAASLAGPALGQRMFHRLRSVEQGVYSPISNIGPGPGGRGTVLRITFDCAPENVDRLIAAAKEEVDRFGRDGLSDAQLTEARLAQRAVPPRGDVESLAEAWVAERTLPVERSGPTNEAFRSWAPGFFRSARLHAFILLPEIR